MKVFLSKDGVEMDYCFNGCKGIWFDRYELAFHTDTEKDVPDFDGLVKLGQRTNFECKKCREALLEIEYVEDEGLKIDVCQKCHGVFLDAQELGHLKKIIARKSKGFARVKMFAQRLDEQGYSFGSKKT